MLSIISTTINSSSNNKGDQRWPGGVQLELGLGLDVLSPQSLTTTTTNICIIIQDYQGRKACHFLITHIPNLVHNPLVVAQAARAVTTLTLQHTCLTKLKRLWGRKSEEVQMQGTGWRILSLMKRIANCFINRSRLLRMSSLSRMSPLMLRIMGIRVVALLLLLLGGMRSTRTVVVGGLRGLERGGMVV
jgi:hypothetical protein